MKSASPAGGARKTLPGAWEKARNQQPRNTFAARVAGEQVLSRGYRGPRRLDLLSAADASGVSRGRADSRRFHEMLHQRLTARRAMRTPNSGSEAPLRCLSTDLRVSLFERARSSSSVGNLTADALERLVDIRSPLEKEPTPVRWGRAAGRIRSHSTSHESNARRV